MERFTQPLSLRLAEPTAERVRRNHEQQLTELQQEIANLKAAKTPGWELIERRTLTSPQSTVTFSGLHGNTDVAYRLHVYSLAGANVELRPNGSTSGFAYRELLAFSGGINQVTGSSPLVIATSAAVAVREGVLYAKAGQERVWSGSVRTNGTGVSLEEVGWLWSNTTDEVTSLDVVGSSNFPAESWFELYRRN